MRGSGANGEKDSSQTVSKTSPLDIVTLNNKVSLGLNLTIRARTTHSNYSHVWVKTYRVRKYLFFYEFFYFRKNPIKKFSVNNFFSSYIYFHFHYIFYFIFFIIFKKSFRFLEAQHTQFHFLNEGGSSLFCVFQFGFEMKIALFRPKISAIFLSFALFAPKREQKEQKRVFSKVVFCLK